MAGGMTRPKLSITKMDWGAIKTLPQVLAFMIGGDSTLLNGLITMFGKHNVQVVGAHEVLPELLAPVGLLVGRNPGKKALRNISKAHEAAQRLGELDIGQAAVAVGGRVVAVEGIEGTDAMLERVRDLRQTGKLTESGKYGVLVKTMKPHQDMRVDLPAIGRRTVEMAANAGLAGIAVEANRSFILEKDEVIKEAKRHGVFVCGFDKFPEVL